MHGSRRRDSSGLIAREARAREPSGEAKKVDAHHAHPRNQRETGSDLPHGINEGQLRPQRRVLGEHSYTGPGAARGTGCACWYAVPGNSHGCWRWMHWLEWRERVRTSAITRDESRQRSGCVLARAPCCARQCAKRKTQNALCGLPLPPWARLEQEPGHNLSEEICGGTRKSGDVRRGSALLDQGTRWKRKARRMIAFPIRHGRTPTHPKRHHGTRARPGRTARAEPPARQDREDACKPQLSHWQLRPRKSFPSSTRNPGGGERGGRYI